LGIEYHSKSKTLYVINHAQAGSRLELFRLWPEDNAATHLKTIIHPQIHSPNSLAVINEHSLYITNDHFFLSRYHPWLAKIETFMAPSIGNVIHFDLSTNTATILDRIAFANGVVLMDHKTLAVASSTKLQVYIYHAPNSESQTPKLYPKHTISVPFLPDNLSVDSNGKLLIAGHPHPFSMIDFAKSRDACNSGSGSEKDEACALRASTGVAEWTESEGLKVLWMSEEFATGSTAVRDVERGVGIVSGLYERGLLVWRE
jgi:arylesterase/paraoxonase